MYLTFTDVAAPCRALVTPARVTGRFHQPLGKTHKVELKSSQTYQTCPPPYWKLKGFPVIIKHYRVTQKDCYGTQIKGKTEFCFFWAESQIRYAGAAFIVSGCSRLYQFINSSHWTEVLSRISESAVSPCWYWELKFALTGNVRNFIEKVVGDEQLTQEQNHKVNWAGVIVLLRLPAFWDTYAIISAGKKKWKYHENVEMGLEMSIGLV